MIDKLRNIAFATMLTFSATACERVQARSSDGSTKIAQGLQFGIYGFCANSRSDLIQIANNQDGYRDRIPVIMDNIYVYIKSTNETRNRLKLYVDNPVGDEVTVRGEMYSPIHSLLTEYISGKFNCPRIGHNP